MNRPAKRVYHNDQLTVFWDAALCTHAGICFTQLPRVFNPRKNPWVNLEGADNERVVQAVNACPTLALTFHWNDPEMNQQEKSLKLKPAEEVEREMAEINKEESLEEDIPRAKFKVMRNGPIVLSGGFELRDANGKLLTAMKLVSLCRCGQSNNTPFCDGTHFKAQFFDDY